MAVSIANYPQTSETSNLTEYDDENVSLASFLPSHTKQALPRLPVTVVPEQNESVANKNTHFFNKSNTFPRSVQRNSSSTNRHSVPSQQINRSSTNRSPVKMRRAVSFSENSVVRNSRSNNNNNNNNSNNNNNKYKNNNNSNSLNTTETKRKSTPSLIIQIPSKVDKIDSPRSSPRSPKTSPKEKSLPKEKSCPEDSPKSSTTQHHHIEQKQEKLDNNKIGMSNNNQDQNEKELNKSSSFDKSHRHTFSVDYTQNQNNSIEISNVEDPQLISNNNSNINSQNSKSQSHNRSFFRHNVTLNNGSSTDLRKSIYKEPSFTKRLRKVFSLSNIKHDDNNSTSTNSAISSASSPKFSSVRGKKSDFNNDNNDDNSSSNNNDKDDNVSVSSVSSNSDSVRDNNKSYSRRRSLIDLFSKNEKKRNKQDKKKQQRQQQLLSSPSEPSNKQSDDNKRDDSIDKMRENEDGNERVDNDPSKTDNDDSQVTSSSPFKQQNSTSPLCNQFRINKSENLDNEQKNDSSNLSSLRPSSLPASPKKEETLSLTSSKTPRRLSVPANAKSDKKNNNQVEPPFANLGAARSVPSLVLLRDTDVPTAPSTPSLKKLQFSSTILVHETWTREDYDRRGDQSTCNKLTPILAQRIKQELNDYKTAEMQVHEDSKNNTHFFV
ncbi:hypothetical protein C1645_758525 [Glomus cerebriforme]|uniref:Uncharacterized protein n=2 Tax=Glomus cerebriforme TaxID=658196 RepID=A0A397TJD9_9GLOM|nr:hypothetical protein C1645_758525 [Glomus cerebriforme]